MAKCLSIATPITHWNLRAYVLAAASIGALTTVPAHATDGYFQNASGAKAKGMGGAAVALPQEALSITANPAAATAMDRRMDFGIEVFIPDRGTTIDGNAAGLDGNYDGNGTKPFILPEFAYVQSLSDTVSIGIAINANGGMSTDYKINPFAAFGAKGDAGVDLKQVFVTPTVAVKVAPRHSVGLSPIILVQGFKAEGIQPFANASSDPSNFTNNGVNWSFGGGFRVGYLGQLSESFSIGAFYQSRINAGKFGKYAGLFAEQGGFDVPASYGAGVAMRPITGLILAADVKRINYAGIQSVGNSLSPLLTGTPFSANGGPGFGWKNITAFKLGASYTVTEAMTLRSGYGRSENPVPSSETLLNILAPGVVRDHFTIGATVAISKHVELTGYAMRAPRNTVEGNGSIPTIYGGGEANIFLAETAIGLSLGWSM